jgi:DNA mismatch repair protein MutS
MNRPEIQAAALRQYGHFKGKHPTCVLFFRMGDFYEAYNDDAVTVARVLELPVTRREEPQPGEPAAVAGISYKEIDAQLKRLLLIFEWIK